MVTGARPRLELAIRGLDPREGRAHDATFDAPVWTWPEGLPSRGALPECLGGRFLPGASGPGVSGGHAIADCHRDDPDRQALAALGREEAADALDALARALGDWLLGGGTRAGFEQRVAEWRDRGFERLLSFDPVHMKAETDHAITFGPRFLDLEPEDLDALLTDLNAWLAGDGMRAERIGHRVYLLAEKRDDGVGPASGRLERAGAPLACLLNRNAGVFIDEQRSEPVLRQWLTELQMWLYPQPMNDRRAARGQPILTSFWPHGMSDLGAGLPVTFGAERLVVSDSPAVLARFDGALAWSPASVEAVLEALQAGRAVRAVLTEPAWCRLEGDLGGFQSELARIDAWLAEVMTAVPRLAVELTDGRGGQWRPQSFWRRLRARLAGGGRR